MDVSALAATGGVTPPPSSSAARVDPQDFMRLLSEQLKNQNPLQPLKDAEFMTQLTQFSQLEEMQAQRKSMEQLAAAMQSTVSLQGLAQASGLIGREISYIDPSTDLELTSQVTAVRFGAGTIQLEVETGMVPLGNVVSVSSAGGTAAPAGGSGGMTDPEPNQAEA